MISTGIYYGQFNNEVYKEDNKMTIQKWLKNNTTHLIECYQYYKNNLEAYDDLGEDLTIQEFAIYLYEQEKKRG